VRFSRPQRKAGAIAAAAAVVALGAVAAMAVTPQGGVLLKGKASHKYEGHRTGVQLKVSSSGEQVAKFWFPACDGKLKNPILKRLKVSAAGKFSDEKEYREVNEGARSGGGSESWDSVYDWKVWVKGRFTAPTKAKGTLSSSYKSFLRDSRTGEPRERDGKVLYHTCKTGKTSWSAKPAS
jgi:hypothetical protein